MLNSADLALLDDLSSRAAGGGADRLAAKHVLKSIQGQPGRLGRSFKGKEAGVLLVGLTHPDDPPPIIAARRSMIELIRGWDQAGYIAARAALKEGQ